jgi:hypothetical protein
MLPNQPYAAYAHTRATFQALTDAIVPGSPGDPGGLDCQVEEFVIWQLDHFLALNVGFTQTRLPLASPTALMLDAASAPVMASLQSQGFCPSPCFPGGGLFASLPRKERIRTLSMLEKADFDLGSLPAPFTYNAGLVQSVSLMLSTLPVFGFYSEWYGYGNTRLATPDYRRMECFPPGWSQVEYPGPALGYRDLRGYPLTIVRGAQANDI